MIDDPDLEALLGSEPTPDFVASAAAEEVDALINELPKDSHRQVALWRLEGYTHQEIAEKLNCTVRTVERKCDMIRKSLERGIPSHERRRTAACRGP